MLSISKTKMSSALLVVSVSIITLFGCGSSSDSTMVPSKLHGIWEHRGYGNVIQINSEGGHVYQFTRATCLKTDYLEKSDIGDYFRNVDFLEDNLTLEVTHDDAPAFLSRYTRINQLPNTCQKTALITTPTPSNTFQHLWHTFNDYYAFFEERNVDWIARYDQFEPQISDDLDDEELFELIATMLSVIDDGHIEITASDTSYNPAKPRGANKVILEAFQEQSEFDDIQAFANAMSQQYETNLKSYLDPESIKSIDGLYPERALWGTINESIGYLEIANMEYFSPSENDLQQSLHVVNHFMSQVVSDFQDTQAMIVDVRFNPGGDDSISLAIANYFTDQEQQILTKKAHYWMGETQEVAAQLIPTTGTAYLKPVIIIAGGDTASAAEIFLMSMSTLPHVTILGENSSGALSDSLDKTLPNGWSFSLSNEVYQDILGNKPEHIGVIPDVASSVFSISSIKAGKNAAIDKSLQVLGL